MSARDSDDAGAVHARDGAHEGVRVRMLGCDVSQEVS
jgi:hypothetical protein